MAEQRIKNEQSTNKEYSPRHAVKGPRFSTAQLRAHKQRRAAVQHEMFNPLAE